MSYFKLSGLIFDKPNSNGRIYSKKLVEYAVSEVNEKIKKERFLVTVDGTEDLHVSFDKVVGTVTEMKVLDDHVVCDVKFLPNDKARMIETLLSGAAHEKEPSIIVSPVGTGYVDENGTVSEYSMKSISFVAPKNAS